MDFLKLLQSLEDAVFEILAWIMLLPKTLLHTTFKPSMMIRYVKNEWEQEPDKRFDEYLSPVIFWLIIAVIPPVILPSLSINFQVLSLLSIVEYSFSNLEETRILASALFALITPLVYITWIEWKHKRPIKKSTLKRLFFIQCYIIPPAQILSAVTIFLVAPFFLRHDVYIFSSFTPSIFLTVYEAHVIRTEFNFSWVKSSWLAIVQLIYAIVIFVLLYNLGLIWLVSIVR